MPFFSRHALAPLAFLLIVACDGASTEETGATESNEVPVENDPTISEPVSDDRLELRIEIQPDVVVDRVPMRTAVLHFHNVSEAPLRMYLPNGEAFRFAISTIRFSAGPGLPLTVPEPRPHGYVVTEADFHLLSPGETRTFAQPFTIDPFAPGGGNIPQRRPGFEQGSRVGVRWTYENRRSRWPGGAQTLDGPTEALFGGEDIPHIWTGSLTVETTWTVP